jgi:hypothetical protein
MKTNGAKQQLTDAPDYIHRSQKTPEEMRSRQFNDRQWKKMCSGIYEGKRPIIGRHLLYLSPFFHSAEVVRLERGLL